MNQRDLTFVTTWISMSADGVCDDLGGMEFWRVYNSWVSSGRPDGYCDFIESEVNTVIILPDAKSGQ